MAKDVGLFEQESRRADAEPGVLLDAADRLLALLDHPRAGSAVPSGDDR